MTIRAAISGLLAGDGVTSDPAAALEEAGFEDISAEEFGTALTHFADTSTLAEADALAPVVTRTGPVPLDETDLPDVELDGEQNDAFAIFGQTVTEVHQDFGESELDELDVDMSIDTVVEGSDDADTPADVDLRFGEPSPEPQPLPEPQRSETTEEGLDIDDTVDEEITEDSLDSSWHDDPFELDNAGSPDTTAEVQEPAEVEEPLGDDAFEDDLDF